MIWAILLLAAGLRFAGLDWGLRHDPHVDEAVYVANVVSMLRAGDLDHRFYNYPGLFFYLLAGPIALVGPERWDGPLPYLVARGVVSAAGVLNVWLLYRAGSRLVGRAAGLVAALLLAVSPLDVQTSHQVRPDVLLEGAGILALIAFRRVGERLASDASAGLLIGLATAVKFTGLLLLPFYVAARLLRPGPRVRGLLLAGTLSALVPLLTTPYALLHAEAYWRGPLEQLRMYYETGSAPDGLAGNLAFYAAEMQHALGPIGGPLAVIGAFMLLRRSWREWLPAMLHPLSVLVVMSTASLVFGRLLLPCMGLVYLAAAVPVAAVAARSPSVAVLCAVLAAGLPLRGSLRYANLVVRPSAADQALDWIEQRVERPSRILETRPAGVSAGGTAGRGVGLALGIDRVRHEVVYHPAAGDTQALARLAPHFDLVITDDDTDRDWEEGVLEEVAVFRYPRPPGFWIPLGRPRLGGEALRFGIPRWPAALAPLVLDDTMLGVSSGEARRSALVDGDADTAWTSGPAMAWIAIELPVARPAAALEIELGWPAGRPPELVVSAGGGKGLLERVAPLRARPSLLEQHYARRAGSSRPFSERLLLDGRLVSRLRIERVEPSGVPLVVRELRLFVEEPGR